MSNETTTADGGVRKKGKLGQRIAYACGNLGQSAFYNAMSTYFIVYVTGCLFSGVDKALAAKLIGVITSLVVIIRIAEIFIDPLLGNLIDNTNTKWGRFRPWQFFGGLISAVLLAVIFSGMFGLVNVNTTLFIVLFVITFVVLDVFYSLRDISYWGMIPALSSDSHERSTYTALGSFGGSIGYNGLTIVVIPIVTYFSYIFTGKHQESQSGWTCFAIIVAILGVLTVCSVAFGTKESTTTLRGQEAIQAVTAVHQLLINGAGKATPDGSDGFMGRMEISYTYTDGRVLKRKYCAYGEDALLAALSRLEDTGEFQSRVNPLYYWTAEKNPYRQIDLCDPTGLETLRLTAAYRDTAALVAALRQDMLAETSETYYRPGRETVCYLYLESELVDKYSRVPAEKDFYDSFTVAVSRDYTNTIALLTEWGLEEYLTPAEYDMAAVSVWATDVQTHHAAAVAGRGLPEL